MLVDALCKHVLPDPKEYRARWLREHPDRVYTLLKKSKRAVGDSTQRHMFQDFLLRYTSDITAFMGLLAECGYFRHAHTNPAFAGGGISDEYLDRIKVERDCIMPIAAVDEFWNNALERELLDACKANDLARVKKAISKGVDCNVRDVRDEKVETSEGGINNGASPVWYACMHGNIAMLRALHSGHAILHEKSYNGGTALHALFAHIHEAKTAEQLHGFGSCFSFLIGAYAVLRVTKSDALNGDFTLDARNDSYNTPPQVCKESKFTSDKIAQLDTLTDALVPKVFNWIK